MKKYIITEAKEVEVRPHYEKDHQIAVAEGSDFMQVSDGYHTMDELYHHRIVLYIALAKLVGKYRNDITVWRSKLHSDGSSFEGWFVLGIDKDKGEQITYHLPLSEWDQTKFAETLEKAPEFDGHTSDDVLLRLTKL